MYIQIVRVVTCLYTHRRYNRCRCVVTYMSLPLSCLWQQFIPVLTAHLVVLEHIFVDGDNICRCRYFFQANGTTIYVDVDTFFFRLMGLQYMPMSILFVQAIGATIFALMSSGTEKRLTFYKLKLHIELFLCRYNHKPLERNCST